MTDADQTANLMSEITEAYRAHAAEEAGERPLTYDEAADGNIVDQIARYRELADHATIARSIATLKAQGTYQPNEHVNQEKFPPLTVAGHLEMLALGERIARYYRRPSQVDDAVRAGASWAQIAAAAGTTEEAAREAYREWAEGQHKYAGMEDGEYATALQLAAEPVSGGKPSSCPSCGADAEYIDMGMAPGIGASLPDPWLCMTCGHQWETRRPATPREG